MFTKVSPAIFLSLCLHIVTYKYDIVYECLSVCCMYVYVQRQKCGQLYVKVNIEHCHKQTNKLNRLPNVCNTNS